MDSRYDILRQADEVREEAAREAAERERLIQLTTSEGDPDSIQFVLAPDGSGFWAFCETADRERFARNVQRLLATLRQVDVACVLGTCSDPAHGHLSDGRDEWTGDL